VCFSISFAHRAIGCGWHPAFPAPSLIRGARLQANLGRIPPRERFLLFESHTSPPVMAGHSRLKNGVASLAYDPAIPIRGALPLLSEITGTSPVMTMWRRRHHCLSPHPEEHRAAMRLEGRGPGFQSARATDVFLRIDCCCLKTTLPAPFPAMQNEQAAIDIYVFAALAWPSWTCYVCFARYENNGLTNGHRTG